MSTGGIHYRVETPLVEQGSASPRWNAAASESARLRTAKIFFARPERALPGLVFTPENQRRGGGRKEQG